MDTDLSCFYFREIKQVIKNAKHVPGTLLYNSQVSRLLVI